MFPDVLKLLRIFDKAVVPSTHCIQLESNPTKQCVPHNLTCAIWVLRRKLRHLPRILELNVHVALSEQISADTNVGVVARSLANRWLKHAQTHWNHTTYDLIKTTVSTLKRKVSRPRTIFCKLLDPNGSTCVLNVHPLHLPWWKVHQTCNSQKDLNREGERERERCLKKTPSQATSARIQKTVFI